MNLNRSPRVRRAAAELLARMEREGMVELDSHEVTQLQGLVVGSASGGRRGKEEPPTPSEDIPAQDEPTTDPLTRAGMAARAAADAGGTDDHGKRGLLGMVLGRSHHHPPNSPPNSPLTDNADVQAAIQRGFSRAAEEAEVEVIDLTDLPPGSRSSAQPKRDED